MTTMMLTALNGKSGQILDVERLAPQQLDELHGRPQAIRYGYDPICKGCFAGVSLVRFKSGTDFWRHLPNMSDVCILAGMSESESVEHAEGKKTIARTLRTLAGWEYEFEKVADGCKIDVYANHTKPKSHQHPVAWEVQLSQITHGEFVHRTKTIHDATGAHTHWVTPHSFQLGNVEGMVVDRKVTTVVGRIFHEPDEDSAPMPMPLPAVIKGLKQHNNTLIMGQSGEHGEWLIYPKDAAGSRSESPRPRAPSEAVTPKDRDCQRPVTPRPATTLAMYACDECGTGISSPWGFTSDPARCKDCFIADPHRYMARGA